MAEESTVNENQEWNSKLRILLVGFPETRTQPGTTPIVRMICDLIPEAEIIRHNIFRHDESAKDIESQLDIPTNKKQEVQTQDDENGDSLEPSTDVSVISSTIESIVGKFAGNLTDNRAVKNSTSILNLSIGELFSPAWIRSEAYYLLRQMHKDLRSQKTGITKRVLLAGHGFGGIVIKQAVAIANKNPLFYDIAATIDSLVFFATPHLPSGLQAWEGLLLKLMEKTTEKYRGSLSSILSGLVDSVANLSHMFFRYEAKYTITNIVPNDNSLAPDISIPINRLGKTVQWPTSDDSGLTECGEDDLTSFEILKTHLAPTSIIYGCVMDQTLELDIYFRMLRILSRSRWTIYECRTQDRPEDINDLRTVFHDLLSRISFDQIRGKSVQVIASEGYGKSAILKLISQHIRQQSPVVIIENLPGSSAGQPMTLFSVLISFVHQILSQKPSCFHSIHNLAADMLKQNVWTVGGVKHLLSFLLRHSQGVDFLVVVYDFESQIWPPEVRNWWTEMLGYLVTSRSSSCTFLISNDKFVKRLNTNSSHVFRMEKEFKSLRNEFIDIKTSRLLESTYTLNSTLAEEFEKDLKRAVTHKTEGFHGSLNEISSYLVDLFEGFPISVPRAILDYIEQSPNDSKILYESQFQLLVSENHSVIGSWARDTLSWIEMGIRPLRMEELAVALAVRTDSMEISDIRLQIFMDIERDIRMQLKSLVSIENGYARLASQHVTDMLNKKIKTWDDSKLTMICLNYLKIVLRKASQKDWWEKCLLYVMSSPENVLVSQKETDRHEPALELLDYVVRHWPSHYFRVKTPGGDLQNAVLAFLEEEGIADKWFQLYVFCNGLPPGILLDMVQAPTAQIITEEMKPKPIEGITPNEIKEYGIPAAAHFPASNSSENRPPKLLPMEAIPQLSAINIARFLGLDSIVALLNNGQNESGSAHIRRENMEHRMIVNKQSKVYLEWLIANDDVDGLKTWIDANMEILSSFYPLHMATRAGSLKSMQLLLGKFATPFDIDGESRTAFHIAAIYGSRDVISTLLGDSNHTETAPKIDQKDDRSQTPLLLAARMGNSEVARYLADLDEGRCLDIPDQEGWTAIHHAVLNCSDVLDDFFTVYPSAISIEDNEDATPLHIAARFGCVHVVSSILSAAERSGCRSATVEAEDKMGRWPLHWAVENGFKEIFEMLLGDGKHPGTYLFPERPLQLAAELSAQKGYLAILRILIDWNPHLKDYFPFLLSKAAKSGQLIVIEFLLANSDVSANGNVNDDATPLGYAASRGYDAVVLALLYWNADINLGDSKGRTPLLLASKNNHKGVVKALIDQRRTQDESDETGDDEDLRPLNINAPDPSGRYTPLHFAASNGNIGIMKLLLSLSAEVNTGSELVKTLLADVNARTDLLETPLHLAVSNIDAVSNQEAAQILIDAGAEVNVEDVKRQSPLHKATRCGDIETVRLLIAKDAKIHATDGEGNRSAYEAITRRNIPVLRELCQKDYSIEYTWDDMETAIEACSSDMSGVDVVKFLVQRALEMNQAVNDEGRSFLHLAAEMGHPEVIQLLINLGLGVNALDNNCRTPLFTAVSCRESTVVQTLINFDADINKADEYRNSPLRIAAEQCDLEICNFLLKAGALVNVRGDENSTALYSACYSGYVEIVRALLDHGADPNLYSDSTWSPLHAASDNLKITKLLVKKGADMDYQKDDLWSPMHLSASWGHQDIVNLLLEEGAEPNSVTDSGETPLHLAVLYDSPGVVRVMVQHRGKIAIDFQKQTSQGLAPIHLAAQNGHDGEIMRILLNHGIDLEARTEDGRSCLDLAIAAANHGSLEVLLNAGGVENTGIKLEKSEMIAAYWVALQKAYINPQCLRILVDKDPTLVEEISPGGLKGFEFYLRNQRPAYGDDLALTMFVELGMKPFQRQSGIKASLFELGIISKRHANTNFVSKCLEGLPEDLTSIGLGFRELRIVTEFDMIHNWTALESLREAVQDDTDNDQWNIDHFLYQSEPRLHFASWNDTLVNKKTESPSSLIRPSIWQAQSQELESRLQIFENGVEAAFGSSFDQIDQTENVNLALRANFPFPPREKGLAYFEMKVDKVDESESALPFIGIGFAGEFSNLQSAHPGWNAWSAAYHGDNGMIYEEAPEGQFSTDRTYGYGCTVGCGIDYKSGEYFFTLGGEVVFRTASDIIYRKLYPCVSHSGASAKVKVNFGQSDFLWKGAKDLAPKDEENTMPPPARPRRSSTDLSKDRSRSRSRNSRDSFSVDYDDRTRRRIIVRSGVHFRETSPYERAELIYDSDSDIEIVRRTRRYQRRHSYRYT